MREQGLHTKIRPSKGRCLAIAPSSDDWEAVLPKWEAVLPAIQVDACVAGFILAPPEGEDDEYEEHADPKCESYAGFEAATPDDPAGAGQTGWLF